MDDPKKVIDRYNAFIKQHADTPAAQEAKNDLKLWEDRQAQHMVKVGDKWVTAAEREQVRQDALTDAAAARDLLAQGRTRDAAPAIEKALVKDPQNPAAHYLKGLMLAKQDQLVPARKEFEAVLSAAPDHAPTLNNLGVILFLTKQAPASLNYYDLAMQAAPGTRRILDNVAEALHSMPEEHRAAAPVKKAVKRFNEQDNMLQGRMTQQNLYRWGSTWVTGEELDRLQSAEDRIKDRLDRLQEDFDAVQERIEQIDANIADTQRTLRRMEANSYTRDSQGRQLRIPLPRVYYDMADDVRDMQREREGEAKKIDKLRRQAKAVQQELPVPRYTGVQRFYDVDGTPLLPPPAPPGGTDQPSERPGRTDPGLLGGNGGGGGGNAASGGNIPETEALDRVLRPKSKPRANPEAGAADDNAPKRGRPQVGEAAPDDPPAAEKGRGAATAPPRGRERQ
jgi:Flp pilus assembly protein TadD